MCQFVCACVCVFVRLHACVCVHVCTLVPLHLLLLLLVAGLRLHLLHLDGVGLPAPHVQLVVAHAQSQDALVDAQPRRVEHKVLRRARGRGIEPRADREISKKKEIDF